MGEPQAPDPIFEAIRKHRLAHENRLVFLSLAQELPHEPERLALAEKMRADAEAAAWEIVEIVPTSLFGLRALAAYAVEFVDSGHTWPEGWGSRLRSLFLRAFETMRSAGAEPRQPAPDDDPVAR